MVYAQQGRQGWTMGDSATNRVALTLGWGNLGALRRQPWYRVSQDESPNPTLPPENASDPGGVPPDLT